ncbi:MAG: outer membrane beta-barrel family protein, partial [Bacteroidia bacterium]|nr:outer membrane beta-barrel family protein [Bacteroidia bacterium]
ANDFMVSPSGGLTNTIAGGINYQDAWGKKIEVSSSYFYNNAQTESILNTFQNFYLSETLNQEYNELDSSNSTNVNHKFNAKLVYKISEKASLYYLPSVSIQQNDGTTLLDGTTTQEASIINALNQTLTSDLTALKLSNNLMFRLNGEKRGRSFFMQGKWDYDKNTGDKFLTSSNETTDTTDVINQVGVLDEKTMGWTGSVMFSEPIGDNGLGGMLTYDVSNSGISALTNTRSNAIGGVGGFLDSSLSSNYTNDWMMHKPGIGFRKFNRQGGFVVKVNYEIALLDNNQVLPQESVVNKTFSSIQPFAIYRKRFKNKSSWFTMYRTYATKPEASQLTQAIDNSNPLQVSTGNADLNQQFGHWIMSKYNKANVVKSTVFYAMINGGIAQIYIGQNTFTARTDTVLNGVALSQGSQMFSPVNLDGQFQSNAFMTYGFPIKKLKSNLNLNVSTGISNLPSQINGRTSNTFNQSYGLGVVLSSNISEKIDFTLSTESSYSVSENSLNTSLNTQYLVQTSKVKYDWIMPMGFTFRTQLQHQQYFGLSDFLDNSVLLWTAGIGKQVFKNKRGEIQLSMYDILGQNNNIAQNFYDSYYEETTSNVLTRYIMASFSYNIRKFREAKGDDEMKQKEEL